MFASFILLTLLSSVHLVFSSAIARRSSISVEFYTDGGLYSGCTVPSTTSPNVTLGLNVCAVTIGLESYVLFPTPCLSGDVKSWKFDDPECATQASGWYNGANDNNYCVAKSDGAFVAIMLTCDSDTDETTPSRPTATTTFTVGPVANEPTSTSGESTATTTASSSNSGGSSGGSTTSTGTDSTATSSSSATGWAGLDYGTRIGIIVSLAVGIPPILIALYKCVYRR